MSAIDELPAPPAVDGEIDARLHRFGIECTDENRAHLAAYIRRSHRSRWGGVMGVVLAAGVGWLGTTDQSLQLGIARLLVGYLAGSLAAELFSPRRQAAGVVHAASLQTRKPSRLLPVWARVLPWLVLIPCLGAPLLLMGDHQTGVTRFHDRGGSGMARAHWFSAPALITICVTALAALLLWRLTLRRLARRRLPVDSLGAARLDLLTRTLTARAVSGAAAALGLCLLGGLASLGVDPLMSMTCTSIADCHHLYAAHALEHDLEDVGLGLFAGAVVLFRLSRSPRVDPSLLRTSAGTSP